VQSKLTKISRQDLCSIRRFKKGAALKESLTSPWCSWSKARKQPLCWYSSDNPKVLFSFEPTSVLWQFSFFILILRILLHTPALFLTWIIGTITVDDITSGCYYPRYHFWQRNHWKRREFWRTIDNHYWERLLLLLIIRFVNSGTSFELANLPKSGSPLNVAKPHCWCINMINWIIDWSSIDWFVDLLMIRSKDCLLYHGLVSSRQSRKPKLI